MYQEATETSHLIGEGDDKLIADQPPEIRAGFIQKVYGILFAQLLLTAAIAAPFVVMDSMKVWVKQQGFPLIVAALIFNVCFLCALSCCPDLQRQVPTNYFLLLGFTATEGVLVGVICSAYTASSVLLAVVATACLVGGLSAYAMYTKTDFTGMGPYLFAGVLVMMIFGLFLAFFPIPFMQTVYCCIGILLFSFYLIYDTQLVMGNKDLAMSIDDYVMGALQLYMDIIQIFLYIVQLLGDRD